MSADFVLFAMRRVRREEVMNTEPFELKPEDVGYWTTKGHRSVRAWVKLSCGGLPAEGNAEASDLESAVIAAIIKALGSWYDTVPFTYRGYQHESRDVGASRWIFVHASDGEHMRSGRAEHKDLFKAVGQAFIAAINNLRGVGDHAAVPTGDGRMRPFPPVTM